MPIMGWLALFLLCVAQIAYAQDPLENTLSIESRHQQGVELARNKNYDLGLYLLKQIIEYHPDYYPAVRDTIIIYSWKNDCDNALNLYRKRISQRSNLEAYLLIAVSECMAKKENFEEALMLIDDGQRRWPNNKDLSNQSKSIKQQIRELEQSELDISTSIRKSDEGALEWLFQTRYEHQARPRIRVFTRLFTLQSRDPDSGNINRIGLGLNYRFNPIWTLSQEFSVEVVHGNEFGSTTGLFFTPNALWHNSIDYTTFSEDLPLRAKGNTPGAQPDATANRLRLQVDFHNSNYQWQWYASVARSHFSDGNSREELITNGSYAFELKEKREQRVMLELSGSQNSLAESAVYFNPQNDLTTLLIYRVNFVLDSKFHRHIDQLQFRLGSYSQLGYLAKMIGGAEYKQEYEVNPSLSFMWQAAYGFNVYDGERENAFFVSIGLRKTFQ